MTKTLKYGKRIKSFEANKVRKIAALDLFRLNERSHRVFSLNQTIHPEYLMWVLKEISRNRNELISYSSSYVLEPLMIHNHVDTEVDHPHVRCTIYSGTVSIGLPLLDVNLDDYLLLRTSDDIGKYDPITNGIIPDINGAKEIFDELRGLKTEELFKRLNNKASA